MNTDQNALILEDETNSEGELELDYDSLEGVPVTFSSYCFLYFSPLKFPMHNGLHNN